MKEIQLTRGQIAIVDDEDYDRVRGYLWYAFFNPTNQSFYAVRDAVVDGKRKCIRMHRVIANTPNGMDTDHENKNTLDNRRKNLRVCTRSQNNCNASKRPRNTSGFKGVCLCKKSNKFRASIQFNGNWKHLGYHPTALEASAAYEQAAQKLHGEFYYKNAETQDQVHA